MTRLWLPFGRRVLVLLTLLAALVALFPMRLGAGLLGLEQQGVTARAISGSVWGARIEGLSASGVALGTVDAALSPFGLLIGQARIRVTRSADAAGDNPLAGTALVSRHSLGVEDLATALPLGAALAPLPVGTLTTSGLSVRFDEGACVRASGAVRLSLTGGVGGLALAQGLSGVATCDGRYLRLPLASQSGQERLDLRVAIAGDYTAELLVAQPDEARAAALTALGFEAGPGGHRLRVTGRF